MERMRRIIERFRMRQSWRVGALTAASLVLLFMSIVGCSKSLYGWQVRTNSTPVAPSFDQTPIDGKRVAILPTLSTGPLQGTAVGMSQYLSETLKTLTPAWKVLTEQEVLTRINKQGLGVEYSRMRGMLSKVISWIATRSRKSAPRLGYDTLSSLVWQPSRKS